MSWSGKVWTPGRPCSRGQVWSELSPHCGNFLSADVEEQNWLELWRSRLLCLLRVEVNKLASAH